MDDIPQINPDTNVPKDNSSTEITGVKEKPKESILLPVDTKELVSPKPFFKRFNIFKKKRNREVRPVSNRKRVAKRVILISLAVFIVFFVLPFSNLYFQARPLIASSQKLIAASKSQDLPLIKSSLDQVEADLKPVAGSYKLVAWMKYLPFGGVYVADLGHGINIARDGVSLGKIVITTIEPYADFLGLATGGAQSGEQTAEDRIDFIIAALPEIAKNADAISEKMAAIKKQTDQIDPNKYPETFQGKVVRENLKKGIILVNQTNSLVANSKPVLEAAPFLLGTEEERTYMVVFQNDKELRPTGGFLTAYSIMTVDKGKFEPVISNDIYNLDARYKPAVAAPDPIRDYLKGPYTISKNLFLRDMNWSPDFIESMDLFYAESQKAGIGDIDGIIAVDTQVLVNLLNVIGQIGVSGFGNFSTEIIPECNCPQVIYELESFADVEGPIVWDPISGEIIYRPPNSDNRKGIIGPLMNSMLANVLAQPKEKLPDLLDAVTKSLFEKHILVYMIDDDLRNKVADFGIAGKIVASDGDYLHINDANLGGRKSNLYVMQEVTQDIEVAKDGSVTKTVSITYKNPEKHDGWLNSVLPNWVRIYVPEGSELISFDGVEDKVDPYTDLGKTVFAGYFELRPEGVARVEVSYKLPNKFTDDYRLTLQKQPGTDKPLYMINMGKYSDEFFLDKDLDLTLPL